MIHIERRERVERSKHRGRRCSAGAVGVMGLAGVALVLLVGCGQDQPELQTAKPHASSGKQAESLALEVGQGPRDLPGLPHVCRVSEKVFSGGLPNGADGFGSLKKLDVRTVISVDGARPDVEQARKFELRYVHLPIGYDGVPREQGLRIARAVRDLPGLVYIHCHHGQHRSPAAAIAVKRCLDSRCNSEKALAFLKQAGTGADYQGLYAATGQFKALSNEELDRVPADFPEVAKLDDFVTLMVQVERHFDHLKAMQAAGWKTPANDPDLDPPHEALLLREAYTELARLPEAKQRGDELNRWLIEAAAGAQALEEALRARGEEHAADNQKLKAAFSAATCIRCHRKYRDVPRR